MKPNISGFFLGVASTLLIKFISDVLFPTYLRRQQDSLYRKNKLLELVYTHLYKITSNFRIENIKSKNENEFGEFTKKMILRYPFQRNLYLWLCLVLRRIPVIRNLRIVNRPIYEVIFNHLEDLISSYSISYPDKAYSEIANILEPNLAICDDKLLGLYLKLKNERKGTILYANATALAANFLKEKPEIFSTATDEEKFKTLLKEEINKINSEALQKTSDFTKIKEEFIQEFKPAEEKIVFEIWLHCGYMFGRLRGELKYGKDFFANIIKRSN